VEVVASLSQGRTAAAQCGLFTYKSVPVIFEPPCITEYIHADCKSLSLHILWQELFSAHKLPYAAHVRGCESTHSLVTDNLNHVGDRLMLQTSCTRNGVKYTL